MSTPAERFAAAARHRRVPLLGSFSESYDFPLDPFQVEACTALEEGHGVLVAAPTGAGKTVVGEFAVHCAIAEGRKAFYTTPIKALSNQKYADLVSRYGTANVGLLTGDIVINSEAPVVVMTTEVLRNMLYAGSPTLVGLGYVVMDEVHYLADRERGAVWEEVILHLPLSVRLISLSATVSNAEEFAEWLQEIRGETHVVVEEHRPVPLWQHVLVDDRLLDLYIGEAGGATSDVHPALLRIARDEQVYSGHTRAHRGGHRPQARHRGGSSRRPDRAEVPRVLDRAGLLPAITFIFSRAGCEGAVEQCLRNGIRLTTDVERMTIRHLVEQMTSDLPESDLRVLGFGGWLDGLERGVAAHHAGMLPRFKEIVEALFVRGLVKAVFATETLALGINMPARSVVLERLTKFDGNSHVDITPGEYTQLTGRAGRRGIDVEGHAVVIWQDGFDPVKLAGLASTRTYPLRSSFRPTYNMAVSLVGERGTAKARDLLECSFAQFQADRAVVGLARQAQQARAQMEVISEQLVCDRGDLEEYLALRKEVEDRDQRASREESANARAETLAALAKLRPGDVVAVPAGRQAGLAIVLDPGLEDPLGPRPFVLTAERQAKRLSLVDFPRPVEPLGHVKVPKAFSARSPQSRKDLASQLRTGRFSAPAKSKARPAPEDAELAAFRTRLRKHPVHSCPDLSAHRRLADRRDRLRGDSERLAARVASRTDSIARSFDRICSVLEERGFLEGEVVTRHGSRLSALHCESDLLLAEALRDGLLDDLDPAEMAAVVSSLVHESRGREAPTPPPPPARVAKVINRLTSNAMDIGQTEVAHRLQAGRLPDAGMAWTMHTWAQGGNIADVLREGDLTAGDFVRGTRQVIDLLGQISTAGSGLAVAKTARAAADALARGVVAYAPSA